MVVWSGLIFVSLIVCLLFIGLVGFWVCVGLFVCLFVFLFLFCFVLFCFDGVFLVFLVLFCLFCFGWGWGVGGLGLFSTKLMGAIDVCHFVPHSVTMTLADSHKISAKQNLGLIFPLTFQLIRVQIDMELKQFK